MTPTQAAFVGCRLLALFTTLSTIRNASLLWSQLAMRASSPEGTQDLFFQALPAQTWQLVMSAFLLALLWACPSWLIRWVAGRAEEASTKAGNTDWAPALLAAVGLYFLLTSLPSVVSTYSNAYRLDIAPDWAKSTFWAEVLTLCVALGFVIGSKRLVRGARAMWSVPED